MSDTSAGASQSSGAPPQGATPPQQGAVPPPPPPQQQPQAAPAPTPVIAAPGTTPQAGQYAPTGAPPPAVAPPAAQKKGLGCWAIGAIVVGALLVLGALVTLVVALFVANSVDDIDSGTLDSTQSAPPLSEGGGTYATEEYDSADFALADNEVVFDDADLGVEVSNGELLVTSRNAEQFNMANWQLDDPTTALMMGGQMSFPAATTASGQEVFGGVTIGMSDDVDYVLLCSTEGGARLQRLEPLTSTQESAVLKEFASAGCTGSFALELEAYSPAGATATELMGTLPSGETFTFTDQSAHGQVVNYGLLVDADTAPVTMAVSSIEVYTAP